MIAHPTTPPLVPAQAQAQAQTEQSTVGFVLSLIGGIIIFLTDLAYLLSMEATWGTYGLDTTMANMMAAGAICGTIVIIGAILIRTPGKAQTVGGILIIIFSLISIIGFGGLIIGLILGTIGGALGLAKPSRTKAAIGFALTLVAGIFSIFWGAGTINEALHPPSGWFVLFTIRGSVPAWFANVNLGTLGWIEVISGIIVIIGAFLILMPGKEKIGSVLAIVFSVIGALILGLISLMFAPIGILGGVLGLGRNSIKPTRELGFAISLIGGSLILINSLVWLTSIAQLASQYSYMAALGAISGIMVLICAILIYMQRKEKISGIIMIAFSIIGIANGGFVIVGSGLGIIGGTLGLLKVGTTKQPNPLEGIAQ